MSSLVYACEKDYGSIFFFLNIIMCVPGFIVSARRPKKYPDIVNFFSKKKRRIVNNYVVNYISQARRKNNFF